MLIYIFELNYEIPNISQFILFL